MLRCILVQYGTLHYACVPLAATKRAKTKHGYLSAISARRKTQCHFASHMKLLVSVSYYSHRKYIVLVSWTAKAAEKSSCKRSH